jgi:hypothetical protein
MILSWKKPTLSHKSNIKSFLLNSLNIPFIPFYYIINKVASIV